jgi:hypothetical protein
VEWNEIRQRLLAHTPPLAPAEPWDRELERHIAGLTLRGASGPGKESEEAELALKAGLLLWNGSLDASHRFSQRLETPLGSYWHGIMHRMEGDYWNANYWFARVGKHPIHGPLQAFAAAKLAERETEWRRAEPIGLRSKLEAIRFAPVWTAATFTSAVELCVRGGEAPVRQLLEAIQLEEIRLLADYSYGQGGGTTLDTL